MYFGANRAAGVLVLTGAASAPAHACGGWSSAGTLLVQGPTVVAPLPAPPGDERACDAVRQCDCIYRGRKMD